MPPQLNERFILAEDEALRAKLQGLKVTHPRDRDVDVWFRWPNSEVRAVTYPFISIDLVDIQKADHREHQGPRFELGYHPVGFSEDQYDPAKKALIADEWPTPYDLYYTVTVVTLDPRHDRELKHKLLGDRNRLPIRWAWLKIPDDETVRRIDVVSVDSTTARRDETEFYTVFTLRVESELFPGEVKEAFRVLGINLIGITDTTSGFREEINFPPPE